MISWSTPRHLSGNTSIFLDAIRFLAAFTVFLAHAQAVWFPERELDLLPSHLSHGAVVVFFVLSGFVIAHTTTNKNRGLKEYAAARFSRLYSIFFPAIVITIICSVLLYYSNSRVWQEYDRGDSFFRYLISLSFCNEIWFFSSAPKINGPIWSLSYEFWYYVIFGCFFYKKKGMKGLLIPIVACLIAGPKIILMMFIWLTGWLVYHLPQQKLKPITAWFSISILLLFSILLMLFLPSIPAQVNTGKLLWADQFITDWVIGLFIAVALFLLPETQKKIKGNSQGVAVFRKLGDLTFPIYVLHFPLLVLVKSLVSTTTSGNSTQFILAVSVVITIVSVIGLYLESKRRYWNKFVSYVIERMHYNFSKFIYN